MRSLIKKIALFLIPFSIIFSSIYFFNYYFTITQLEVIGNKNLKGLSSFYNKNLLLLSIEEHKKILYATNPEIRKVQIEKQLPNKLKISVENSPIIAVLPVANGYYFLSQEGRVLAKKRENKTQLPQIKYYQRFNFQANQVGETLGYQDILYSLELLSRLSYIGVRTDSIDINGLDMIVLKKDQVEYVFTTKKNVQEQYEDLKLILEQFKIQ
ncbi:MAG TPA: FtsQ-type POTRA domain-containing protein, partial [Candidatus Nitrosocosmicus sp.]|nr:FtsQ-type POTRA domain-containing protein [Candidatus Nitrosocosmicus sp.]